jgi:hypothetical protein
MRPLIAALLLLASAPSSAQEAWVGYGVGAQGCGKYIEQRRTPNKYYDSLVGAWFYGFITAYNYYGNTPQVKRNVEQETVLAFLDKYCREAPLASVSAGALELVKTYAK